MNENPTPVEDLRSLPAENPIYIVKKRNSSIICTCNGDTIVNTSLASLKSLFTGSSVYETKSFLIDLNYVVGFYEKESLAQLSNFTFVKIPKRKKTEFENKLSLVLSEKTQNKFLLKIPAYQCKGILSTDDIVFAKACGKRCFLYDSAGVEIEVGHRLGEMEKILENRGFYRCHHSYLVNLSYVHDFVKKVPDLLMKNGIRIPVSRNMKGKIPALLKLLNIQVEPKN